MSLYTKFNDEAWTLVLEHPKASLIPAIWADKMINRHIGYIRMSNRKADYAKTCLKAFANDIARLIKLTEGTGQ